MKDNKVSKVTRMRIGFVSIFIGIAFIIYQSEFEQEFGIFIGLLAAMIGIAFLRKVEDK